MDCVLTWSRFGNVGGRELHFLIVLVSLCCWFQFCISILKRSCENPSGVWTY